MFSEIPAELKALSNWIVWKMESQGRNKPTKVPYNAQTGGKAMANEPATWTTFECASAVADPLLANYEGIGLELGGTDLVGIDFDGAVDAKGVVDPYVLAIIESLGRPYTEYSPSGRGLHSFVSCAVLPEGGRKLSQDHVGIEIYHGREGGRYLTMTGNKYCGSGVPKVEDMSIPYLLITQFKPKHKNFRLFKELWIGDISAFGEDDSSADYALLRMLAQLTQNDAIKMEKLFGLSAIGKRDKWRDRDDYRQRSIKAAIDTVITGKPVLPPTDIVFHTPALLDPDGEYVVAPLVGQLDGWFPLGDVSLIGGSSGTGKTTFIFEMLHKQKQGYPVLGHTTHKFLFHVLAYDRGKNAFMRTMRRLNLLENDIPTTPLRLAFGTDAVQGIINEVEKLNPIPSIIFIEGLDMLIDDANKKSTVSPFMRQLQEVAAHFHIALICSVGAPKTKRGEDYAAKRDKLSGSEAWGRNCETVAVLEFSEEDDGTAPRRELTILPRNASAEKFSLEFQSGRLVQVEAKADEDPEEKNTGGAPPIARQRAIHLIERALQHGPLPDKTVRMIVKKQGVDKMAVKRAADDMIDRGQLLVGAVVAGGNMWELAPMHEMEEDPSTFVTDVSFDTGDNQ